MLSDIIFQYLGTKLYGIKLFFICQLEKDDDSREAGEHIQYKKNSRRRVYNTYLHRYKSGVIKIQFRYETSKTLDRSL